MNYRYTLHRDGRVEVNWFCPHGKLRLLCTSELCSDTRDNAQTWGIVRYTPPDNPVPEQDRCWGTGTHGGPCPHRAETDVGLCLDCRDEIRARVDDG